ncbi:MAG: metallophosphoesterase [Spirochaeta sp.]|nr:metallophosphoesterase [Spirochaeta sp.]
MRDNLFVIGDIHVKFAAFEAMLEKIESSTATASSPPRIVLVGDLVDRGPESAAVVARVAEGVTRGSLECVLGNHDEMFLQALLLLRPDLVRDAGIDAATQEPLVAGFRFAPKRVLKHWLGQGGAATIRSYGGDPWRPDTWTIPTDHVRLLATLPLAWSVDGVTVTHARANRHAITEALARADEPWRVSERSRYSLLWNRESVQAVEDGVHLCGHTPRESPMTDGRTREIDTGCVFGRSLTAYCARDGTYIYTSCTG